MRTVWDAPKRERNLKQHRLDFAEIGAYFNFSEAVVVSTYSGRSGRVRLKAIGTLKNRLVVLVFSPLGGEAISLISLRPANKKERKLYDEN